jgi:hypothetical protein
MPLAIVWERNLDEAWHSRHSWLYLKGAILASLEFSSASLALGHSKSQERNSGEPLEALGMLLQIVVPCHIWRNSSVIAL